MRQTLISDRNVRVALASAGAERRCARRSALARLLLNPALALLLLALAQPMFACVIPVAPDFQDPLAASNSPPYLHDWSPPFGMTVPVISTASNVPHYTFSSQVTDLNVNDTLYVRWILNYPPASGTTTAIIEDIVNKPPATGATHEYEASFDMYCRRITNTSISAGVPQHLTLVVSDRAWAPTGADDEAIAGGHPQEIDWTLIFQCAEGTQ